MVSDNLLNSVNTYDPNQQEEYFFIQAVVWREIADGLLAQKPTVSYVDVRDKADSEIAAVLRENFGRLDKYLEQRGKDFLEGIKLD